VNLRRCVRYLCLRQRIGGRADQSTLIKDSQLEHDFVDVPLTLQGLGRSVCSDTLTLLEWKLLLNARLIRAFVLFKMQTVDHW